MQCWKVFFMVIDRLSLLFASLFVSAFLDAVYFHHKCVTSLEHQRRKKEWSSRQNSDSYNGICHFCHLRVRETNDHLPNTARFEHWNWKSRWYLACQEHLSNIAMHSYPSRESTLNNPGQSVWMCPIKSFPTNLQSMWVVCFDGDTGTQLPKRDNWTTNQIRSCR